MKTFVLSLKLGFMCLGLLVFLSCQSKPCNIQDRTVNAAEAQAVDAKVAALKKDSTMKTIKVFKPDGTLQCNQGKAISLKDMEAELKQIKIISSSKVHDGLMRLQVCGQPTGMSNVFEIAETDLEKAKAFGFKLWKKD